jgi:alkaline phosphatase D
MRHRFLAVSRELALLLLVVCAVPVHAKLVVMHGYADVTSALVWIQAESAGPIRVSWLGERSATERTTTLEAKASDELAVVARLGGLAPGERVAYRIEGDGDVREGSLRAQPAWTDPALAPEITIAIGSCFFVADADPAFGSRGYAGGFEIFDAIAAKQPDLMLWLGDNLYFQRPDFLDPASMSARHRRQRAFEPLARLLTATSHIAIWDDHDFGWNDADSAYPLKAEALRLFRLYWANASYGLPDVPGIFGYMIYGDVDLLLLDGRYYRTHPRLPGALGSAMFGNGQLAWLMSTLMHAHGALKIVASGSQLWNTASRFEGLHQFPAERNALAQFLLDRRIEGLLFVSGDRHFGELLRVERPGAYPLLELTSSPLTARPWAKPETRERVNPQVVAGTLVGKRQFGLIRVTGPGGDRRIALESYDTAGELLWRHELRASDLRFARKAAPR